MRKVRIRIPEARGLGFIKTSTGKAGLKMKKMKSETDSHIIYRAILKLESSKAERTVKQLDKMTLGDSFSVSWFPHETVLEALIKQKVSDLQANTIDEVDAKMMQILSLDGIVEGFMERYDCSCTFKLPSETTGAAMSGGKSAGLTKETDGPAENAEKDTTRKRSIKSKL